MKEVKKQAVKFKEETTLKNGISRDANVKEVQAKAQQVLDKVREEDQKMAPKKQVIKPVERQDFNCPDIDNKVAKL